MADTKPLGEAKELLGQILGDNNKHVESYISSRRGIEIKQQAQRLPPHITVSTVKSKQKKKPAANSEQVSSAEKVDSVKDLEAAMKKISLESEDRKMCDCMGSVHGLLEIAPNCLNCGRITCNKEGLGPCMYCKEPLLPNEQLEKVMEILTEQKNSIVATMSKKALVAAGIDPESKIDISKMSKSRADASKNLDRLLGYQENDTARTRIIDRVGDVDLPLSGGNKWATPSEQAELLKAQQKVLRRREVERKIRTQGARKVLSIDVRGNKVYQTTEDAPMTEEYYEELEELSDDNKAPSENASETPADLENLSENKTSPYFNAKLYEPHMKRQFLETAPKPSSSTRDLEVDKLHIQRDENEDLLY